MEFKIKLPENYIINSSITQYNSDDWVLIFDCLPYFKEILNYISEIQPVNRDKSPSDSIDISESSIITKALQTEKLSMLSDSITEKNKQISSLMERNKQLEDRTFKLTNTLQTALKEQSQTIQQTLHSSLEPIKKFYSGTNSDKGSLGEDCVYQRLTENQKYYKAKIKKVGHETACGDINFRWDKLKLLIEIKNKASITVSDLEKFKRDMEDNKDVNSGLFISLRTNKICPDKREYFNVDYIDGKPIVYLYMCDNSMLDVAIDILNKLMYVDQKSLNSDKRNKKLLTLLIKQYNNTYEVIEKITKNIKKRIDTVTKLSRDIKKDFDICQKLINDKKDFDDSCNEDDDDEDNEDKSSNESESDNDSSSDESSADDENDKTECKIKAK